jgi:hypothetical protein
MRNIVIGVAFDSLSNAPRGIPFHSKQGHRVRICSMNTKVRKSACLGGLAAATLDFSGVDTAAQKRREWSRVATATGENRGRNMVNDDSGTWWRVFGPDTPCGYRIGEVPRRFGMNRVMDIVKLGGGIGKNASVEFQIRAAFA